LQASGGTYPYFPGTAVVHVAVADEEVAEVGDCTVVAVGVVEDIVRRCVQEMVDYGITIAM